MVGLTLDKSAPCLDWVPESAETNAGCHANTRYFTMTRSILASLRHSPQLSQCSVIGFLLDWGAKLDLDVSHKPGRN